MTIETQTQGNYVSCDGPVTLVKIDGKVFGMWARSGGMYVYANGTQEFFYSARVASAHFRQLVETAALEQEARRRWAHSFQEWLVGVEMYDSGADEGECASPSQARGWKEQREYREQAYCFMVDGSEDFAGPYAPVAVEECELLPL